MSSGYSVSMSSTGFQRSDAEETHEQILDAASRIISEEPFEALSMRRVARDAGVSLSTVVRHFGTKDELLAALAAHGEDDPERSGRYQIEPGHPADAVRAVVDDYEAAGDTFLNVLSQEHRFPALSDLLETGRKGHREWVRWAFGPQLRRRRGARRQRTEDLLVVATDVYTWKLLRRDRSLSVSDTCEAMTELVDAVVHR